MVNFNMMARHIAMKKLSYQVLELEMPFASTIAPVKNSKHRNKTLSQKSNNSFFHTNFCLVQLNPAELYSVLC